MILKANSFSLIKCWSDNFYWSSCWVGDGIGRGFVKSKIWCIDAENMRSISWKTADWASRVNRGHQSFSRNWSGNI